MFNWLISHLSDVKMKLKRRLTIITLLCVYGSRYVYAWEMNVIADSLSLCFVVPSLSQYALGVISDGISTDCQLTLEYKHG